jgi:hypothetical protein
MLSTKVFKEEELLRNVDLKKQMVLINKLNGYH